MKKTTAVLALAGALLASACSTPPTSRDMLIGGAALAAAGAVGYYAAHHKKDHGDDAQANQEDYQQGFDDARNRVGMNDQKRSDAYVAGYNAGREALQQDRELARTRRRQGDGYVEVADLVGVRASAGESELRRRGFDNVGGAKGRHDAGTAWWNARANECVRVTTDDGRYSRVNVVGASACH
ncbi:MAG: hypothetical protein REI09_13545 [Candidatus Dactylopiibacterium sp.]|nr:hypothetical protein [Candidatus Dactylopiibacterium sp.]